MSSSLLLPLRLLALCLLTQSPSLAAEVATRAPIWELKSDSATVFLAGSVHLLRETDLPIPAAFDEVYEAADRVVFELDMNEMRSPATAMAVRRQGMLPEGEKLSDYFSPELLDSIKDYARGLGLPAGMLEQMKPGTLLVTLTSLGARKLGARPDLGIELQYHARATEDGKPTSGLETMEYQMGIFHQISPETLTRLFEEMIEEEPTSEESLDDIIAAWKSGDPGQIESIIVAELAEEPEVKRLLLDDRNRNWIPAIEKALEGDETVLFIVGAAHLAGEGNVLELLKERGREVVRFGE